MALGSAELVLLPARAAAAGCAVGPCALAH